MQERYQTLIDNVSSEIARRLFEDREFIESEHRLEVDALIFELMMHIGLAALGKLFESLSKTKIEECRQKGMCIAKSKTVRFSTKLGTLKKVSSPYMRDRHTGESARPMKEVYGVVGQGKSLALERALSDFGSEDSYADAETRFYEHYGFKIGRTSILRVTDGVGEDAEEFVDKQLEDAGLSAEAEAIETLIAELDGSAVRCGEYMPASQAGLTEQDGYQPDDVVRRDEFKEVRVAVLRDAQKDDKRYLCRMDDYEAICSQMKALAESMGWEPSTQVVSPADGAQGLREALEETFEDFQFILDIYHLRKHLYETAEALGLDEDLRDGWVETFIDQIWEGNVDKVLDQLRSLHEDNPDERLNRLIRYLDRFSECVDYGEYRQAGWPVGSGEVESAHKYIPQARLKLPGACWHKDSINPMMAIRVIKKNGWWNDFWKWRHENKKAS